MTAQLDFDALEKLAAGMTPGKRKLGPYYNRDGQGRGPVVHDVEEVDSGALIAQYVSPEDARAIAALDRETVLALLALARRTKEAEASWRALADEHNEACAALGRTDACAARIAEVMRERDEARAALAEAPRTPGVFAQHLPAWPESRADVQGGGLPVPVDHEALASMESAAARGLTVQQWLDEPAERAVTAYMAATAPPSSARKLTRPPLDPTHVEVLLGLAEDLRRGHMLMDDAQRRQRVAALDAVIAGSVWTDAEIAKVHEEAATMDEFFTPKETP